QSSNVSSKKTIRDSFCLPVDKTIFGYIGKYETMGESKGVDEIIEAFSLAFAKNKDIYLLLVGVEDAERSKIFATIDALKLPSSSYSIFVLDQSKFAEYLVACDVLLMNYPNTEHYAKYMSPTKLFAYLATGLPIISSDLPSVRSVAGEEVVLYVEPGDTEKYAKVMLGVFNNLGTVNNQSDQRIRLAYNFEWPARAKRIIDNLWQCN
ncbi:MAG: glycosyltransferase, partial [Bdellovibrionales bacterium]|nr:glycosyltransferase [Bdellovibrionales bacterium]